MQITPKEKAQIVAQLKTMAETIGDTLDGICTEDDPGFAETSTLVGYPTLSVTYRCRDTDEGICLTVGLTEAGPRGDPDEET